VILTIDLGTSVTKAALWNDSGLVAAGHATLTTAHHGGGKVEQDASTWWRSVEEACHAARTRTGVGFGDAVDAMVFAAARQTFVPVTTAGRPVGPALLWSDRRAQTEAAGLAEACGGADNIRSRTGAVLDGAAVAAKVAWLAGHEPDRLIAADWLLSPRDLMVWELTGVVATDVSLASATGLYDAEGREVPEVVGAAAGKLPEVVAPDTVVGKVRPAPARGLGVKAGIPVVIGAGDRACEVLGTGASAERPMVAWGTTANLSVPVPSCPHPIPDALTVTRGAPDGWLIEGGLSAAGSLLAWLGGLTGTSLEELARRARTCPPGARGVLALPWPGGARAPWWCDHARAGFVGLGFEHGPADLARSVLEAVAFEVARCLDAIRGTGADPRALAIGGSAATGPAWTEVLTGVTGLPALRRRSGEAAMAGAALLASAALGAGFDLERLDPVATETTPSAEVVERYAELRRDADRLAAAVLSVGAAGQGATTGGWRQ
jgi:xylulokinase